MVHPAVERAAALGAVHEAGLSPSRRRQGAHYTPADVAGAVVGLALGSWRGGPTPRIVDPACGAGVFLVAAAQALADRGIDPLDALGAVAGADIDPGAVTVARRALDEWARHHGVVPQTPPEVAVGDGLGTAVEGVWDVVVGNPPFQGQLRAETARDGDARRAARRRWGPAGGGYVDTAALFLAHAVERSRPGGVVALIQPRSMLAARHAAGLRRELARAAPPVALWAPGTRLFAAEVDVVAPVLAVGAAPGGVVDVHRGRPPEPDPTPVDRTWLAGGSWAALQAAADSVPEPPELGDGAVVGDVARVVAGFRDQYYGLVPHVVEGRAAAGRRAGRLVTVGAVDLGGLSWGETPVRFARRRWSEPWVDLDRVEAESPRLGEWLAPLGVPKVLVATQTRRVEAAVDPLGDVVPVTPLISAVPTSVDPWRLAAGLVAPPVAALAHWRLAGSGMSRGTIRLSASEVAALPMPPDGPDLDTAVGLLQAGPRGADGWARLGRHLCRAHGAGEDHLEWWLAGVAKKIDGGPAGVVS